MAKDKSLKEVLEGMGERISKAQRVRSLLQMQKGFWKKQQSLTDFREPVLDLHRRDGRIETYENATAGKFVFTHSNGQERYAELRPSDQEIRDYGAKKVRWYTLYEDAPFANYPNPIVDGESVMIGYEKTKSTDAKYQASLLKLKNEGKIAWVWIIVGIAAAIAIVLFAVSTWGIPKAAPQTPSVPVPPIIEFLPFLFLKNKKKNKQ